MRDQVDSYFNVHKYVQQKPKKLKLQKKKIHRVIDKLDSSLFRQTQKEEICFK